MKWNEIKKLLKKHTVAKEKEGEGERESLAKMRNEMERSFGAGIDHTRLVSGVRIGENGRQSTRDRNDDDSSNYISIIFFLFLVFLTFPYQMDIQCQQSYSTLVPFFFVSCGGGFADVEGGSRPSNEKESFFVSLLTFFILKKTNNSPRPRCFYAFCVNNATPTRHRLAAKIGTEDVHVERDLDY